MSPELTDGVVVLSGLTADDAPALVAGEDAEIAARLAHAAPTLAAAQRYIARRADATLTWGIRDAASGDLAGTAEAALRFPGLPAGAANLSYGAFPAWRGRGYAGRAVELMCAYLAARGAASLAVLRIDRDNAASLRVAERCRFRAAPELAPAHASMRWFSRSVAG